MALWGKLDDANSVPKFLSDSEFATPQTSLDNVYFVDLDESQQEENRERGIKTPGWTMYREYGAGRKYIEPLVAMRVSAEDAGDADANTIVNAPEEEPDEPEPGDP